MVSLAYYLYLRPTDNIAAGSTVTGTVAPNYQPEWLCDARTDRPARAVDGSDLSLTVTFPTAGNVSLVVISHTNLDVNATIGGTFAGVITPDADMALDGIPLNGFLYGSSVAASGLTLATSGNALPATIGELYAGVARTLRPFQFGNFHREYLDWAAPMRGPTLQQLPYREGAASAPLSGGQIYSTAERDDLIKWRRAQKNSTQPSILILDPSVNDALAVIFSKLTWDATEAPGYWQCGLEFMEIPRTLW